MSWHNAYRLTECMVQLLCGVHVGNGSKSVANGWSFVFLYFLLKLILYHI